MQHDPDPPIEQVRRELLRTLRRELFGRLNDARGPLDASDLDAWDPSLVARVMPYITRYRDLYFRSTIEGGEHLPEGPFMLVGAHAGGVMTLFGDGMIIHSAVYEHFQCRRPIYVMAHRLLYYVPKINRLALRLGVVEGSRRTARKVFDHGHALSVFPGGDYDVARTWRQRNRIDFHGRTGFVRMALEAGVPIGWDGGWPRDYGRAQFGRALGAGHRVAAIDRHQRATHRFVFSLGADNRLSAVCAAAGQN